MVFIKGKQPARHQNKCQCFRCTKVFWNKGKKTGALSDVVKKKISLALKGIIFSEERKQKIRLALKGKQCGPGSKGTKRTIAQRKNISEAIKNKYKSGWVGGSYKGGKPKCEDCGKILSTYKKNSKCQKCYLSTEKTLNRLKESGIIGYKKSWDREHKDKHIKNILKGLIKRPTNLEQDMIDLIKKYQLPYKYVGNGSFLIGWKNPDFININGEKKLIEVGNVFHHQDNYIEKRQKHFAKYGWKSYIFISDKLDRGKILSVLTQSKGGEYPCLF